MAVINRTPDSFYDRGATYELDEALTAADRAVQAGADILDIGGVKAGPGDEVTVAEEIRRVVPVVAGADLLNDAWGGADPGLAGVAAAGDLGLVCAHAGGAAPRTRPHRPAHPDLVGQVIASLTREAERAVAAGVRPDRIVIDPAHDFGKNTWHSLELTRRTGDLADTGWPVLVAASNKDFVGEALGLGVAERGEGSLAVLAVCAWEGARLFRVHDVAAAKEALDVVRVMRAEYERRCRGGPGARAPG
jgi:dihydropteroate synthase